MINFLHSLIHRPSRGWDPVGEKYAAEYSDFVSSNFPKEEIGRVEEFCGGLRGKQLLDIGAGPGDFSVEFARRGADVLWHDVSAHYRDIAAGKARHAGVSLEFSLGYLEGARRLRDRRFDVVFNRSSYYYAMNDRAFARLLYDLVKPGGSLAVFCILTTEYGRTVGKVPGVREWLNAGLNWKIGHPLTPPGRVAALLARRPHSMLISEHRPDGLEEVMLRKTD